ncbi:MAG TPA: IclR family transcriptional regulator [Alphaproteobacteria bacterium]|nr:IclR family transcriptional regulator [Alphaproteobacteria bacterium]
MSTTIDRAESGTVKSVVKVLDILECLGAGRRPMSVSEVARATSINVSTAHRLLQTLARRGYIEQRAETRNYALGPRLLELGSAYAGNQDLLRAALPHLEALRDQVHETIHLGILSDGDVVEICNASGSQPVSVSMKTGRRDPAHCTAIGKVLLAALSEAELDRLFTRGPLLRATARSITSRARLLKEIDRARRNGYALDEGELADELCCVGVPIVAASGRAIAGVSIAMPKMRFRPQRVAGWVKLLTETSRRIAAALGPSHG